MRLIHFVINISQKCTFSAISRSPYAMVTLLYRTLQSTLKYDTVIRRIWVIGCRQQFAFKTGQTAADRDMATIDSPQELVDRHTYPTLTLPTPYNVLFSHNTCVTDDVKRQANDGQTIHWSAEKLSSRAGKLVRKNKVFKKLLKTQNSNFSFLRFFICC